MTHGFIEKDKRCRFDVSSAVYKLRNTVNNTTELERDSVHIGENQFVEEWNMRDGNNVSSEF